MIDGMEEPMDELRELLCRDYEKLVALSLLGSRRYRRYARRASYFIYRWTGAEPVAEEGLDPWRGKAELLEWHAFAWGEEVQTAAERCREAVRAFKATADDSEQVEVNRALRWVDGVYADVGRLLISLAELARKQGEMAPWLDVDLTAYPIIEKGSGSSGD